MLRLMGLDELPLTAAVLVAGYGGVGIHTVLSVLRLFPNDFKNFVFLSVGVIDSGSGCPAVTTIASFTRSRRMPAAV